jgi:hypothetical protein
MKLAEFPWHIHILSYSESQNRQKPLEIALLVQGLENTRLTFFTNRLYVEEVGGVRGTVGYTLLGHVNLHINLDEEGFVVFSSLVLKSLQFARDNKIPSVFVDTCLRQDIPSEKIASAVIYALESFFNDNKRSDRFTYSDFYIMVPDDVKEKILENLSLKKASV